LGVEVGVSGTLAVAGITDITGAVGADASVAGQLAVEHVITGALGIEVGAAAVLSITHDVTGDLGVETSTAGVLTTTYDVSGSLGADVGVAGTLALVQDSDLTAALGATVGIGGTLTVTGQVVGPVARFLVAIYNRLSNDSTLGNLALNGGTVTISDLPAAQCHGFPLLTLGDISLAIDDTKTSFGWVISGRLHCWSEYQGSKEWAQIIDRCFVLLHRECLSVSEYDNWLVFCDSVDNVLEPDGVTRHGILSYTARIAGSF
jgi:hypothetical protein